MLNTAVTHPDLLAALARGGHGTKLLLADGNYPHVTGAASAAERIYLNLAPGMLSVTQVLTPLVRSVPIEAAEVMYTAAGEEAPVVAQFRDLLPDVTFSGYARFDFYAAARAPDVGIVIATGEQRLYANLLLTIGVRAS